MAAGQEVGDRAHAGRDVGTRDPVGKEPRCFSDRAGHRSGLRVAAEESSGFQGQVFGRDTDLSRTPQGTGGGGSQASGVEAGI
ncbi:MAG: hypothetical protein D0530_01795 [Methylococcales bacterium]|nr:MAG: hypothetical protein D0530_01795 [Methylococcales bacterium]